MRRSIFSFLIYIYHKTPYSFRRQLVTTNTFLFSLRMGVFASGFAATANRDTILYATLPSLYFKFNISFSRNIMRNIPLQLPPCLFDSLFSILSPPVFVHTSVSLGAICGLAFSPVMIINQLFTLSLYFIDNVTISLLSICLNPRLSGLRNCYSLYFPSPGNFLSYACFLLIGIFTLIKNFTFKIPFTQISLTALPCVLSLFQCIHFFLVFRSFYALCLSIFAPFY